MKRFKNLSFREKAEYISILVLYPFFLLFGRLGRSIRLFGTKRRQITASALSLAVILSMLSFSAFAADFSDDTDFGISVYDVAVTGANYKDVLAGTENAGTVSFDPDGNVLTLKGLNLSKSASRYYNLLTVNRDSITVRLEGENSLTTVSTGVSYAIQTIKTSGNLTFDGTGSLLVETGKSKKDIYGIKCEGSFAQKGGNVIVKNSDSTATKGLYNNQAVYVSGAIDLTGGKLTAEAGKGIQLSAALMTTSADINITDATAVLVSGAGGSDSYALYTNENITVTNSKLDLSSADVSGNSYAMQTGGGKKLSVTNSEITATSGAGEFSLPIWTSSAELKDSTVTAAGGTASCESYGMSAAEFQMDGGTVSLKGGDAADWSIGLWSSNAKILNGTLKASVGTADGTNAITSSPSFGTVKMTVVAGTDEETAVKVTEPTDDTYWSSRYVQISPYVHEHEWSIYLSYDLEHHWRDCIADDCDITADSDKKDYAAHSYTEQNPIDRYRERAADYLSPAVYRYSCVCGAMGTETFEYGDVVADEIKPGGDILISENSIKKALNAVTFGLFFKDTQTVTVTAYDNESGLKSVEYLKSPEILSETALAAAEGWSLYETPISVEPLNPAVIYVKITDMQGNVTLLCSDGITVDNIAPVIEGIEQGKTYCEAKTVTVNEQYVDSVTVNGQSVELDQSGAFELLPKAGEQKIVVSDKAGNTAEMTVTVNDGHTPEADDGDCTTPVYCLFCKAETAAAKEHDFSGEWQKDGEGHYRTCLNEGCTVSDEKIPHSAASDGDCTTDDVCECGYIVTAAKDGHDFGDWLPFEDGSHIRSCKNDGCEKSETENCAGTPATCTEKSVCETCGGRFGQLDPENHTDVTEWITDETTHQSKYKCCGADAVSSESHLWKDGVCEKCGYACKHSGGTAYCDKKAVCDVCGQSYGEFDPARHGSLNHVPAVAATFEKGGNIEYWMCEACEKYFADEKGENEITNAQTVAAKLEKPAESEVSKPAESEVSKPETSDESVISSTESETSNAPSTETQNPKSGDSGAAAAAVFAVLGGGVLVLLKKRK